MPLLKITPEVRKRAANLMNAADMSPKTVDYLQNEVGPTQALLDDQDYVGEQLKTPKKRRLHRSKEDKAPKSPAQSSQEEEPFMDRLIQYIMANKKHITGLTMQTIATNQWVTVNIKSEPATIDLPDFGDINTNV